MSFYYKTNERYRFNIRKGASQDCLFHAIYFLDFETGSLLVSNRFSDHLSYLRDDLICSFLKGINMFINELKEGVHEELQEINFKDTRIIFERENRLLVIAVSGKKNLQMEREILREILEDFYIRFKNHINNFNGSVAPVITAYKKRLESMNLNSILKFKIGV
ncbi:MAG: hypothetical protein Lokiarch_24320 [Candidatus Lokiarchaeum sp. GC14_75]|nr:MAG: hypothetical protein Lokiarch_24320 [Candidatus Lokiarchaeum sp. GC14_75]